MVLYEIETLSGEIWFHMYRLWWINRGKEAPQKEVEIQKVNTMQMPGSIFAVDKKNC